VARAFFRTLLRVQGPLSLLATVYVAPALVFLLSMKPGALLQAWPDQHLRVVASVVVFLRFNEEM
jgi:hypothetical protein